MKRLRKALFGIEVTLFFGAYVCLAFAAFFLAIYILTGYEAGFVTDIIWWGGSGIVLYSISAFLHFTGNTLGIIKKSLYMFIPMVLDTAFLLVLTGYVITNGYGSFGPVVSLSSRDEALCILTAVIALNSVMSILPCIVIVKMIRTRFRLPSVN